MDLSYSTYFSEKNKKVEKISKCIYTLDTLKFFISIAWEARFVSHKQYEDIAVKLGEIGKMFWGWRKSLENIKKENPA